MDQGLGIGGEFESLILSHHSRCKVTCECNEGAEAEAEPIGGWSSGFSVWGLGINVHGLNVRLHGIRV